MEHLTVHKLGMRPATQELIYIVDDDPVMLELTAILLEMEGYATRAFKDPQQAYQAFATANPRPRFLMTDYVMDGLNGIELIARCLKLAPQLKTILMSGSVGVEIFQDSPVKPHQFLHKPFKTNDLMRVVNAVMSPAGQ